MPSNWFETVAEAQRRAKKRLPKGVYGALVAGSERGLTTEDNTAAYSELGFYPHVADLSTTRDLSTTVDGPAHVDAGADLTHRSPGRPPRRRSRRSPSRRGTRHPDGTQLVCKQAPRGSHCC